MFFKVRKLKKEVFLIKQKNFSELKTSYYQIIKIALFSSN